MKKNNTDIFKKIVSELQKDYNLMDWEILISADNDEKNEASAEWYPTFGDLGGSRTATIYYDKEWIETASMIDIYRAAFHEIFEIKFSKLRDYAEQNERYISKREVNDEIHSIIRVLENKFYPKNGG